MKLHRCSDEEVAFHCPGCKNAHVVSIAGDQPVWGWNGSMSAPTFSPSIRVRGSLWEGDEKGWNQDSCCHSFVTDGNIQFLSDSTHELAGKTVPVPDWEV